MATGYRYSHTRLKIDSPYSLIWPETRATTCGHGEWAWPWGTVTAILPYPLENVVLLGSRIWRGKI